MLCHAGVNEWLHANSHAAVDINWSNCESGNAPDKPRRLSALLNVSLRYCPARQAFDDWLHYS